MQLGDRGPARRGARARAAPEHAAQPDEEDGPAPPLGYDLPPCRACRAPFSSISTTRCCAPTRTPRRVWTAVTEELADHLAPFAPATVGARDPDAGARVLGRPGARPLLAPAAVRVAPRDRAPRAAGAVVRDRGCSSPTASARAATRRCGCYPDAVETLDALRRRGVRLGAGHQRRRRAAARQGRALRPRAPLRPRPDRGRARLRQARGAGLPPRARVSAGDAARDLDGRRQPGVGGRGAAAARHLRDLVSTAKGRACRAASPIRPDRTIRRLGELVPPG